MKAFLQSHWKLVLGVNLLLGVVLWIVFLTDVSLRGTIPDILFPPATALFALLTLGALSAKRKIGIFAYIPSFGGGCLYLFMGLIMIVPPFTLAFLFGADEIANEVRIQKIESPNQINIAEVYFRPVGAYTGGSGKIYIRVTNKYIPFFERDIFSGKTYAANEDTTNYASWIDDNTLYITENDEKINIRESKPEIPTIAVVPLMSMGIIQNQIEESQLTAPLQDIPIYPAVRNHESIRYWDFKKTSERIYFLSQGDLEEVYDWHISNLAKSPWKILDVQIVPNDDPAYEGYNKNAYCITAQKNDNGQETIYYFEIFQLHELLEPDYESIDPNIWDVRVIVTTPNPDSIYCWLK